MTSNEPATLIVVRHGETEWNIQNRFQGRCDSPLSQRGREQSRAVGRRLENYPFNALIASDLGRAKETAAIIAGFTGHKVQSDPRLRERNYGILEGLLLPEIEANHGAVLKRLKSNDPDFIIPEGESHRQHYDRNMDFIHEKITETPATTSVLVVHGGVLDNLFRFVSGIGLERPRCFITLNASLTILKYGFFYGSVRWVIETWGDVAHLDGIGHYTGLG
jgi:probable phosphoglycerate mutase